MIDRLNPNTASSLSADGEVFSSLPVLRNRSRQLERDEPLATKFYHMLKSNVIGQDGIRLQGRKKDNKGELDSLDNDRIEAAWQAWGQQKNCTVTGRLSWVELQNLAIQSIARDGEVLIRLVTNFANDFGFALQIIEADHLDIHYNTNTPGKKVVMGIELDEWCAPIAYNLLVSHPGDNTHQFKGKYYHRVPASEIIHLYKTDRPGQSRGVPWMHSVIKTLTHLGAYGYAELVAARQGACKMGFYKPTEGAGPMNPEHLADDPQVTTGKEGELVATAQPGEFPVLPPGVDFQSYDPQHPNNAFDGFVKAKTREVSSGLNVSYAGISSDLEGVNYSSIRSGVIDERDQWRALQKWLIRSLHTPVYQAWLFHTLTFTGQLPIPARQYIRCLDVAWQPRGWTWVDPLKDQQGNQIAVNMYTNSLTDIAATQGKDFEDICRQVARDKQTLEKHGLTEQEVISHAGKTS